MPLLANFIVSQLHVSVAELHFVVDQLSDREGTDSEPYFKLTNSMSVKFCREEKFNLLLAHPNVDAGHTMLKGFFERDAC